MLRIHSSLAIRPIDNRISCLHLQSPVKIDIPLVTINSHGTNNCEYVISTIPAGTYLLKAVNHRFCKIRGELFVGGIPYHIEIISVGILDGPVSPVIVRMWSIIGGVPFEYLFSGNVTTLRMGILQEQLSPSPLLTQLVSVIAGVIPGIVSTNDACVVGGGTTPFLVPNFSRDEYIHRFDSVSYHNDLTSVLLGLVDAFYAPGLNTDNLLRLIGILSGDIPHTRIANYVHDGTFLESPSTNTIIGSSKQYFAIQALTRSPFDHFYVNVDVVNNQIVLDEVGVMAGPYFNMDIESAKYALIKMCNEFLTDYFITEVDDSGGRVYVDVIDERRYIIDRVYIRRTMDEYITISIESCDYVYERGFDIILLTIMSPVIGI